MRARTRKIEAEIKRWKETPDEDKIKTLSISFRPLLPRLYQGNLIDSIRNR